MKITCKENLIHDSVIYFYKGETYYFRNCNKFGEKYVICDKEDHTLWYLSDDYEKHIILERYFYTEKEYRKLKILQLNERMSI